MVPIRAIAPIGAIGNYWATHHLPTREEVNLLQALADITAVSIENVNVYRELEQRVKDRTAQLEAANKELEAFSYSVSHDLRAPLRSIIGYANVLEEDHATQLDDTGRHVLQTVLHNAGKMNTLIDEMLQFSRVGKKPLEKTSVDNEKLVRSVIEDLNHSTPNKALFEIAALPPATADEVLLQQVWVNLLSNAVKYSSKKDQPIISVGSYKNGSERVYFVKDNGAGFDMKYAEKLFGAFQRLHRMNDFPGSGVGLALAYRIITRHGGKIWAEGKVNEGATFYFSLPIVSENGIAKNETL